MRKQLSRIGSEGVETGKGCHSYIAGFIPNTIGFLLATPIDDPLIQFYFGRLAGLLLFILAFWYSLKIIPKPFHLILYLYGTLPMVLHQVTAYNDDVLFLAIIPLVFSHFVKIYSGKIFSTKDFLLYQASILLLVLSKHVSIPFVFLHFLLPPSMIFQRKNAFIILSILFFFLSIFSGLYFNFLNR